MSAPLYVTMVSDVIQAVGAGALIVIAVQANKLSKSVLFSSISTEVAKIVHNRGILTEEADRRIGILANAIFPRSTWDQRRVREYAAALRSIR